MSTPARRPGGGLNRRQRERRAFNLVVTTGTAGLATVVTFALAVFGVVGFGLVFILAIVTALAAFMLRRTMST